VWATESLKTGEYTGGTVRKTILVVRVCVSPSILVQIFVCVGSGTCAYTYVKVCVCVCVHAHTIYTCIYAASKKNHMCRFEIQLCLCFPLFIVNIPAS